MSWVAPTVMGGQALYNGVMQARQQSKHDSEAEAIRKRQQEISDQRRGEILDEIGSFYDRQGWSKPKYLTEYQASRPSLYEPGLYGPGGVYHELGDAAKKGGGTVVPVPGSTDKTGIKVIQPPAPVSGNEETIIGDVNPPTGITTQDRDAEESRKKAAKDIVNFVPQDAATQPLAFNYKPLNPDVNPHDLETRKLLARQIING